MGIHKIALTINGNYYQVDVPSNMTLLTMLRDRLALTGTKNGCSAGECGACTIMMNGEPVNSCMVLAVECDRAEILTVEGLSRNGKLNPIQQAFLDHSAIQCGFCTPGMLISAIGLLSQNPNPSELDIREALVGNLCRCTGYASIIAAVQEAAHKLANVRAEELLQPTTID